MALGTEALCDDLELKPDDFRILIFAWKCNAEQVGFVYEVYLFFENILKYGGFYQNFLHFL